MAADFNDSGCGIFWICWKCNGHDEVYEVLSFFFYHSCAIFKRVDVTRDVGDTWRYILIISILFRSTRSISDELEFFIGNFTILTQLCDFFCCVLTFCFNERFSDVTLDHAWQMTNTELIISSITSRWSTERCY